jgi:hypothetical protein
MKKRSSTSNITKHPARRAGSRSGKRWVARVTTDSTHPQPGLFYKGCSDQRSLPCVEAGLAERPKFRA